MRCQIDTSRDGGKSLWPHGNGDHGRVTQGRGTAQALGQEAAQIASSFQPRFHIKTAVFQIKSEKQMRMKTPQSENQPIK